MTVLAPLMIAGCTSNPDPHQGGFINGIVGLTSGSYQQRLDQRQQTVDQIETSDRSKEQLLSDIELERVRTQQSIANLEAALAAAEQRNRAQRDRLLALQQQKNARSEQLAGLLDMQQDIERSIIALVNQEHGTGVISAAYTDGATQITPANRAAIRQENAHAEEIRQKQDLLDQAISDTFGKGK